MHRTHRRPGPPGAAPQVRPHTHRADELLPGTLPAWPTWCGRRTDPPGGLGAVDLPGATHAHAAHQ